MAGQASNHDELVSMYGQKPDDKPPFLQFEQTALPDNNMTHQANDGKIHYRDVHLVHVMARGDTKCIVPHIVKGWKVESKMRKVKRQFKYVIADERVDDDGNVYFEDVENVEERTVDEPQLQYFEYYPWFDKLNERLRNGEISQAYVDFCKKSYDSWVAKNDAPVTGIPLKEWTLLSETQKKNFLEIGINTVELLAEATEEALMLVPQGREAKKKAQHFLSAHINQAQAAQMISSLEGKLDNQIQDFQQQRSEYEAKIAQLEAMVTAQADASKRGRKKKEAA